MNLILIKNELDLNDEKRTVLLSLTAEKKWQLLCEQWHHEVIYWFFLLLKHWNLQKKFRSDVARIRQKSGKLCRIFAKIGSGIQKFNKNFYSFNENLLPGRKWIMRRRVSITTVIITHRPWTAPVLWKLRSEQNQTGRYTVFSKTFQQNQTDFSKFLRYFQKNFTK